MNHVFLVVDDYTPFRNALARALEPYGEVQHAGSVAEGKAEALRVTWSALFIDVTLPDGNGLDVLSYARAHGCMAPALVLTGSHDPATINRAFGARARFMVKPADWGEIKAFVRQALSTEERISDVAARWTAVYGLSKTECMILVATASGSSREEIVNDHEIAEATFKRHVVNILAKTGDLSLLHASLRLLREVDTLGRH